MAIEVEIWQQQIEEELFASNTFINHLHNADEHVVGGRIVHIPQSGGPANVVRNRSVFPATARRRTDNDITYILDEFSTDPDHIHNAEMVELSYSKTQSVIRENTEKMMEEVGDWMIWNISKNAAAGNKLATTGAQGTATAPGATGTRKILTHADVRAAKTYLNNQNVSRNDRYMLLSSNMIDHLAADKDLVANFQGNYDIASGVVGELEGFKLIDRSKVITMDASQGIKLPTAASATDDDDCALFWQKSALERALGDITMYDNYGRAEYYGDIYSFLIRASGRARRQDNKGYGLIYGAA